MTIMDKPNKEMVARISEDGSEDLGPESHRNSAVVKPTMGRGIKWVEIMTMTIQRVFGKSSSLHVYYNDLNHSQVQSNVEKRVAEVAQNVQGTGTVVVT